MCETFHFEPDLGVILMEFSGVCSRRVKSFEIYGVLGHKCVSSTGYFTANKTDIFKLPRIFAKLEKLSHLKIEYGNNLNAK